MDKFIIEGGKKLQGRLQVKGAKNSILPVMAASVLNSSTKKVELQNVPLLHDMQMMKEILESLGARVAVQSNTLQIDSSSLNNDVVPDNLMRGMRSSIFLMGALLGRLGKVKITHPGGCSIGPRPIDLHLKGLEALGAEIDEKEGHIIASTRGLYGTQIHMDYPSVGATENLMMAAVLAKGKTVIYNVAKEPEIVDLQNFLNAMGASVRGAGTETLVIKGVDELEGCTYRIIPDRIVAGTYLMAAAITGGNVLLKDVIPTHLDAVLAKMREAGVVIEAGEDTLEVIETNLKGLETLRTLPYPGFPTDLQPPMMALLSLARDNSVIVESVFEARFRHAEELRKMGARISVEGRSAFIEGVDSLFGAEVDAPDLRAGAALVLAGLAAGGTTTIKGVQHIDRGYEQMEKDLQELGARIKRDPIHDDFNTGHLS